MTALKRQAVTMVEDIPDDKMSYVVDMLRSITSIIGNKGPINTENYAITSANSSKQEAWKRLQKYKGFVPNDMDEKAELARARDEKYADSI